MPMGSFVMVLMYIWYHIMCPIVQILGFLASYFLPNFSDSPHSLLSYINELSSYWSEGL